MQSQQLFHRVRQHRLVVLRHVLGHALGKVMLCQNRGDKIAVKNGIVFLNGQEMSDPHAHREVRPEDRSPLTPRDNFGPVTVPEGRLFMMGDNRDRSYDSRFWGFVDRNEVEGRAILIYWSWDSDGTGLIPLRWDRFGKLIY